MGSTSLDMSLTVASRNGGLARHALSASLLCLACATGAVPVLAQTSANVTVNVSSGLANVPAEGYGVDSSVYDGYMLSSGLGASLKSGGFNAIRYPGGSYATYQIFFPSMTSNYYYGIRRYPYSTDMAKSPLTFRHISDVNPLPNADPNAPVVYFLHGIRWNLTGQVRRLEQLREFGFSVFAIDYRGFGKSDGALPSEQMTYEDAAAGWKWLVAKVPNASHRFIYGHSLGGAVAIDLAARLAALDKGGPAQAHGLIVESTFTSLPDIAAELSWSWLPTRLIMSQRFDSIEKVRTIDLPVLFVHGTGDRYVPAKFSQALYDAAPDPKQLLLIENGGHNNATWIGDAHYRGALSDFCSLPVKAAGPATHATR